MSYVITYERNAMPLRYRGSSFSFYSMFVCYIYAIYSYSSHRNFHDCQSLLTQGRTKLVVESWCDSKHSSIHPTAPESRPLPHACAATKASSRREIFGRQPDEQDHAK